jgi:hypothetical protein
MILSHTNDQDELELIKKRFRKGNLKKSYQESYGFLIKISKKTLLTNDHITILSLMKIYLFSKIKLYNSLQNSNDSIQNSIDLSLKLPEIIWNYTFDHLNSNSNDVLILLLLHYNSLFKSSREAINHFDIWYNSLNSIENLHLVKKCLDLYIDLLCNEKEFIIAKEFISLNNDLNNVEKELLIEKISSFEKDVKLISSKVIIDTPSKINTLEPTTSIDFDNIIKESIPKKSITNNYSSSTPIIKNSFNIKSFLQYLKSKNHNWIIILVIISITVISRKQLLKLFFWFMENLGKTLQMAA